MLKSGTRRLLDRTAASNLDYLPQCLSGPERDYILVGGTTAEGRPVTGTLASVPDCPVDVYAQAEGAQRGLVQPEGGGADGGAMWRNCIGFAAGQVVSQRPLSLAFIFEASSTDVILVDQSDRPVWPRTSSATRTTRSTSSSAMPTSRRAILLAGA